MKALTNKEVTVPEGLLSALKDNQVRAIEKTQDILREAGVKIDSKPVERKWNNLILTAFML